MFLDASVLVAVLAGEGEAEAIHSAILESERLATSPLAVFEASSRIARLRKIGLDEAYDAAMDFLTSLQVEVRPIDTETGRLASQCAARYHYLSGHFARLNMGDCFAYASAHSAGMKLAYKGDDFIHTDIEGQRFGS